jgi:hypothetical protein
LTINLCSFKATSQTDNTVQVSIWSELRTRVTCSNPLTGIRDCNARFAC